MRWLRAAWSASAGALVAAVAFAGCSQTTRVDEAATSGDALTRSQKGVAVMRLGASSASCDNVGVWLGVREGTGFRIHTPVSVVRVRSLEVPPVAEVELPAGEYHVVSYACGNGKEVSQIADTAAERGLTRTSYASFTVAAGEVVNVGSFELTTSRRGTNALGRRITTTVSVTDWPLADLERYKARRPQIWARMQTRLMTPSPSGAPAGRRAAPGSLP